MANAAPEAALRAPLFKPWLAYLQAEAGELRAAADVLRPLPREFGPTFALEFAGVAGALVAGRLGNVFDCARAVEGIATTEECRSLRALIRAAHVERVQGNWNAERSLLDSAIETLSAGRSRFLVWALAEAVTGAWFAGDDRARQITRKGCEGPSCGTVRVASFTLRQCRQENKSHPERSHPVGWQWLT